MEIGSLLCQAPMEGFRLQASGYDPLNFRASYTGHRSHYTTSR